MARFAPPDTNAGFRFDFDADGPSLGPVRLLEKTPMGYAPKARAALEDELSLAYGRRFDCSILAPRLAVIGRSLVADVKSSQAALDFAEQGPRDLGELVVSGEDLSFSSHDAFFKLDLEKRFGSPGEGFQYHHIVEQGPNSATMSRELLQSTSNIVKIPTLVHEEVSAIYSTNMKFTAGNMTLREFLRGASYEQQRAWGLWALQRAGALK